MKFYCSKTEDFNEECIIPVGLSEKELYEREIPRNCTECPYYIERKTKEQYIVSIEKEI